MILNVNRDPTSALAVLETRGCRRSSSTASREEFTTRSSASAATLNDTRLACDVSTDLLTKAKCEAGMSRAFVESGEIAELDRTLTIGFLRQFRSLVAQLAQARDRRTIGLLSDGFEIVPGREAFDLVDGFFPLRVALHGAADRRLQLQWPSAVRAHAG